MRVDSISSAPTYFSIPLTFAIRLNARRHETGVPASEPREAVAVFTPWRPAGMNFSVVERGWYWMNQAQLLHRDSLIPVSAEPNTTQ
jgi:hypothetical protein